MIAELGDGTEFDLIRQILAARSAAGPHVVVDAGDDCAVVEGGRLAISTDLAVEGVHFERAWLDPEEIGYRAAAAALSDLAAMAASPVALLVSVGAPSHVAAEVPAVMRGVHALAAEFGATVVGGDLSRAPVLLLDVTVLGAVETPVRRTGAQPGDGVWVTGALGGAAAAVAAWKRGEEPRADARAAFARPRPRIAEALWLAERAVPHAMLDLSDGIAGDARHLAAAGGVAIALHSRSLPLHDAASAAGETEATQLALAGGEDYELCFSADDEAVSRVRADFEAAFGVALTRVGAVSTGKGVTIESGDDESPLDVQGYRHFEGM